MAEAPEEGGIASWGLNRRPQAIDSLSVPLNLRTAAPKIPAEPVGIAVPHPVCGTRRNGVCRALGANSGEEIQVGFWRERNLSGGEGRHPNDGNRVMLLLFHPSSPQSIEIGTDHPTSSQTIISRQIPPFLAHFTACCQTYPASGYYVIVQNFPEASRYFHHPQPSREVRIAKRGPCAGYGPHFSTCP
jgi:hypothetical protein